VAQTPRELTPHASLRHFFGAELRHWRQLADLSHDRLGAQINYSGAAIGKVEKAERAPTAALAEACDQVLGTGGALARLDSHGMALRPARLLPPKRLSTPHSAHRVSTTNQGLLPDAPVPAETGLPPAGLIQPSGHTTSTA
jgi:transcriptional regulator with XRE-family HTH domain